MYRSFLSVFKEPLCCAAHSVYQKNLGLCQEEYDLSVLFKELKVHLAGSFTDFSSFPFMQSNPDSKPNSTPSKKNKALS